LAGESNLKLSALSLLSCIFLLSATFASAQQFDVAFGLSGLKSTPAADASSDFSPQEVGGGVFPTFSGDFLFKKQFGVGGEVSWRAKQNLYQAFGAEQPFRPILYDFGAVWAPKLGKRAAAELTAGIGGESVRFYTPFINCSTFSCTDFVSSNHLLGQAGGGIRLYVWNHVFVRPEAHFYFVRNNNEFSGPNATRIGVSVGYSWTSEY
jgi:hypothetical protein